MKSYLEILTPETKSKITEDENGENEPSLKVTEVVLGHCNIISNDYQHNSRFFHTFVPNKSFDQLWDISPKNFIFLKTFHSEFSYNEACFTDQNSNSLEIEDKINIKSKI